MVVTIYLAFQLDHSRRACCNTHIDLYMKIKQITYSDHLLKHSKHGTHTRAISTSPSRSILLGPGLRMMSDHVKCDQRNATCKGFDDGGNMISVVCPFTASILTDEVDPSP